jgi:hypothetical protein
MDPEVSQLVQAIQVLVGWKTNFKTRRADSKIEERPLGTRHPSSLPTTTVPAFQGRAK